MIVPLNKFVILFKNVTSAHEKTQSIIPEAWHMKEINEILRMLHWNNSIETQEQGLILARNISDIEVFCQPLDHGNKSIWDNCAKIIAEKSDDVLVPYLQRLLEWLEDLNWPGAFIVLDRLKCFSGEKIEAVFLKFVNEAIRMNNNQGTLWLLSLSELLENEELKARLPKDIKEVLQYHYHNWTLRPKYLYTNL